MKKLATGFLFVIAVAGLVSFRGLSHFYNDIFTRLGLGTEEAESYIVGNIIEGGTGFPMSDIMRKLAMNKRAAVVKEIGDYVKSYTRTAAFAEQYKIFRMEARPVAPPGEYGQEAKLAHNQDLKRWEAECPATVNALVKKRLMDFLAGTADINFNAKLVRRGSKMVFADPVLEAKDDLWKYAFRSGEETVAAARGYAQQWLLELK
ncbi:hypothetical protein ACFSQD_04050 [Flavihumibacter stibioxidans]|uniref:Uncharacterized protein n=1 Tax=Flavihumibacter stibioxidans TaxID=1834163 RepID=A0ABR7M3P8_9BACT|nr:hypothetical protein [Flavihumibacter stibioxidans]MBC6489479.1 hypothetical protein [Flavihumibacter stibioxidans]